jgi:hypothetical protein
MICYGILAGDRAIAFVVYVIIAALFCLLMVIIAIDFFLKLIVIV